MNKEDYVVLSFMAEHNIEIKQVGDKYIGVSADTYTPAFDSPEEVKWYLYERIMEEVKWLK